MPKLPYFAWYPSDAENDADWRAMSYEERGVFITLLNTAWDNDGLDPDLTYIARSLKISSIRFAAMWKTIGRKFFIANSGRLVNPRQEKERTKAQEKSALASKAVAIREQNKRSRSDHRPIIGDGINDHPRASESDSYSQSVSSSTENSQDLKLVPIRQPNTDESFAEFEAEARAVGMIGSEDKPDGDWYRARTIWWPRLSLEERVELMRLFRERVANGNYDDPKYVPGVVSFFNGKWKTPVRPKARDSPAKSKAAAFDEFLESVVIEEKPDARTGYRR